MLWWIIGIAAAVALILYRSGPNAVWGTATLGVIIGVVIALIQPSFDWSTLAKSGAVGALIGVVFELLPKLANR